jgi:hypothetical protein
MCAEQEQVRASKLAMGAASSPHVYARVCIQHFGSSVRTARSTEKFDTQHSYAKPSLLRIVRFRFAIPQTARKDSGEMDNLESGDATGRELSNIWHFLRG